MKIALLLSGLSLALATDRIPYALDFPVEKALSFDNNSTAHARTCTDAGYGPCISRHVLWHSGAQELIMIRRRALLLSNRWDLL